MCTHRLYGTAGTPRVVAGGGWLPMYFVFIYQVGTCTLCTPLVITPVCATQPSPSHPHTRNRQAAPRAPRAASERGNNQGRTALLVSKAVILGQDFLPQKKWSVHIYLFGEGTPNGRPATHSTSDIVPTSHSTRGARTRSQLDPRRGAASRGLCRIMLRRTAASAHAEQRPSDQESASHHATDADAG